MGAWHGLRPARNLAVTRKLQAAAAICEHDWLMIKFLAHYLRADHGGKAPQQQDC